MKTGTQDKKSDKNSFSTCKQNFRRVATIINPSTQKNEFEKLWITILFDFLTMKFIGYKP